MNFTLRQLDAFVTVAKNRNFSRAATALNVSQPALTLMVQKLEAQLGVTLFERRARGTELTTEGRELLPDVQQAIETLESMVRNLGDARRLRGGRVRIASLPSLCADILPRLVSDFIRLQPQVRVELSDAVTWHRDIVDLVRNGEIDFAFSSFGEDDEGLVFQPLVHDTLWAVLPAAHALAGRRRLRWKELADQPLIGMSYTSHVRMLVEQAFASAGVAKRPRYEAGLVGTAVGMARAGLGVAIVPQTAAAVCDQRGVACIALAEPVVRRPLGFIFPSRRTLTPAAASLMQFMHERIPALWPHQAP